jgi:ribonuclease P protein component
MRVVPKVALASLSDSVAGYGFPCRYKLIKTDEFSSVFSFRRRILGDCLAVHYKPNTLGYPRLGIVVSKKSARLAVARNYMRRVLREWFRLNRDMFGGIDLVVRVNKPFNRLDFARMVVELEGMLSNLKRTSSKSLG